ncbi:type III secretion protein U [Kluyvera sp. 1366]
MEQKTELPTPTKLKKSRSKGEVSQTQELHKIIILIIFFEAFTFFFKYVFYHFSINFQTVILFIDNQFTIAHIIRATIYSVAALFIPLLLIPPVVRIFSGWFQFGPLFSFAALTPKFNFINPIGQFKKMFSTLNFSTLFMSILKTTMVFLILFLSVKYNLINFNNALRQKSYVIFNVVDVLIDTVRFIIGGLFFFSFLDFLLQKHFFIKKQKMSLSELKKEMKDSDGDPLFKSYRRSLAFELSSTSDNDDTYDYSLEDADVILINPTHYAIGLLYVNGITPLPKVILKKEGYEARLLIRKAHSLSKPVIKNIKLTRSLYLSTPLNSYIPREELISVGRVYRNLIKQRVSRSKV